MVGADADAEPDRIAIDQSLCGGASATTDDHLGCGNQATRWLGFTSPDAEVAQMLVVVGDDDDAADTSRNEGFTENLSFMGPTLAEDDGQLALRKSADRATAAPGERVTYTLTAKNIGDRDVRSEERRVGKECRSRWSPYH